jgi:hypothetical protein
MGGKFDDATKVIEAADECPIRAHLLATSHVSA